MADNQKIKVCYQVGESKYYSMSDSKQDALNHKKKIDNRHFWKFRHFEDSNGNKIELEED